MKEKIFLAIFLFQVLLINGQTIQIIPSPASSKLGNGYGFSVKSWVVNCENGEEEVLGQFKTQIERCGIDFSFREKGKNELANLMLRYVPAKAGQEAESYRIIIDDNNAIIEAVADTGLFYGLQTLAQLTETNRTSAGTKIPPMVISDHPRFHWRGVMLDESRHFFGVEKVKQLLDWMAFYKLNKFHWHLTDVSGWRIEIKKYPLLTQVGALGNHSNPNAPAKYYTQDEIKEIVQYASERYIEVIPEIDMPGHATAANKAYPEYSGGGSESYPHFTFNPGDEETYGYLTNILREVTQLFPSKYIHLGGDEVHFGNEQWNIDPQVQELMRKHQLKNLQEVEFYFIKRMTDSVSALNKTMIGWDEIVSAGIAPEHCRVMWWRHNKLEQLMQGLKKGYETIMCPRIPFYFDFVQDSTHTSGRRWQGDFVTIEKILAFNQIYKEPLSQYSNLIKGIQANIWSETIHSGERLNYMTYPRIAALAEIAWTSNQTTDYKEFLLSLQLSFQLYKKQGISYFNPEDKKATPEIKGPNPRL